MFSYAFLTPLLSLIFKLHDVSLNAYNIYNVMWICHLCHNKLLLSTNAHYLSWQCTYEARPSQTHIYRYSNCMNSKTTLKHPTQPNVKDVCIYIPLIAYNGLFHLHIKEVGEKFIRVYKSCRNMSVVKVFEKESHSGETIYEKTNHKNIFLEIWGGSLYDVTCLETICL